MPGPFNFDFYVLGPTFDVFAEPVNFFPKAGGGPIAGRGVFDQANKDLDLGGGSDVPTTTEIPTLGVRLSEFTTPPLQNDQVQIPSVNATYMVKEVRIDGHGWARLMLSFASSP